MNTEARYEVVYYINDPKFSPKPFTDKVFIGGDTRFEDIRKIISIRFEDIRKIISIRRGCDIDDVIITSMKMIG